MDRFRGRPGDWNGSGGEPHQNSGFQQQYDQYSGYLRVQGSEQAQNLGYEQQYDQDSGYSREQVEGSMGENYQDSGYLQQQQAGASPSIDDYPAPGRERMPRPRDDSHDPDYGVRPLRFPATFERTRPPTVGYRYGRGGAYRRGGRLGCNGHTTSQQSQLGGYRIRGFISDSMQPSQVSDADAGPPRPIANVSSTTAHTGRPTSYSNRRGRGNSSAVFYATTRRESGRQTVSQQRESIRPFSLMETVRTGLLDEEVGHTQDSELLAFETGLVSESPSAQDPELSSTEVQMPVQSYSSAAHPALPAPKVTQDERAQQERRLMSQLALQCLREHHLPGERLGDVNDLARNAAALLGVENSEMRLSSADVDLAIVEQWQRYVEDGNGPENRSAALAWYWARNPLQRGFFLSILNEEQPPTPGTRPETSGSRQTAPPTGPGPETSGLRQQQDVSPLRQQQASNVAQAPDLTQSSWLPPELAAPTIASAFSLPSRRRARFPHNGR